MEYPGGLFKTTHVVVLGNEKGGSGKTTTAMHVVVALLAGGKTVGTIDLDSRQQSLTRYLENREDWARRKRLDVPMPEHYTVAIEDDFVPRARVNGAGLNGAALEIEQHEFAMFADAITNLEHKCDFIVIDTPGNDNALNRLGHSMADTLITPINDSFLDLDVIAHVEGGNYAFVRPSQYAQMVKQARKRRESVDGGSIDWVIVRNRLTVPVSHNNQRVAAALDQISATLDFRLAPGVGERVIFRELFPRGLTMFDVIGEDSEINVTMSHLAGRQEVHALLSSLNLPIDYVPEINAGIEQAQAVDALPAPPKPANGPDAAVPARPTFTVN